MMTVCRRGSGVERRLENDWGFMRRLIMSVLLTCAASNAAVSLAYAQEDTSIYGTYGVSFQPSQVGGELKGCTLVYRAVQADHAYLRGKPVVIVGNIGVQQFGGSLLLTLKIGVKDLTGNQDIVRPNFAYLQTKTKSTAKVKQVGSDGDEGYRLFAYSLYDSSVLELFKEMTDSRKVTIGFNRKRDGMDVLVPVDLDVIDAEYPGGDRVVRKRSNATLEKFLDCFSTLVEQAKSSLDKK